MVEVGDCSCLESVLCRRKSVCFERLTQRRNLPTWSTRCLISNVLPTKRSARWRTISARPRAQHSKNLEFALRVLICSQPQLSHTPPSFLTDCLPTPILNFIQSLPQIPQNRPQPLYLALQFLLPIKICLIVFDRPPLHPLRKHFLTLPLQQPQQSTNRC